MLLEEDLKRNLTGFKFDPISIVIGVIDPDDGTSLYSMLCLVRIAAGMIPPPLLLLWLDLLPYPSLPTLSPSPDSLPYLLPPQEPP